MSLRVLLADKSTSIEKVFRMGLKDLGVEVKSVHNGLEVLKIAETYTPHIIFIDILLQKKNGYEITRDLSQNSKTKHIPVVLMWSPFMELDQKEYQNCGAKAELEKPFEIENMRQIFNSLIEKTKDKNVSDFLDFHEEAEIKPMEENQNQTEDKVDKYNFFPISGEEGQKETNNKEDILAQSLEKFKPDEKFDEESHSFFNLEAKEKEEFTSIETNEEPPLSPLKPDEKKEEKYNFSFTESDLKEIESKIESKEDIKISPEIKEDKYDFSFTELDSKELGENTESSFLSPTEEKSPDPQKIDLLENQPDISTKPVEKNIEAEKLDSNQIPNQQTDEKLELNDFLFQPDPSEASSKNHLNPTQEIKSEPNPQNLSSIPPETHSFLEKIIRDQLPGIIEKVVREELERIFKQEMALKKLNNK